MRKELKKTIILQGTEQGTERKEDTIVNEFHLAIFVNKQLIATLTCSPAKLDYLTTGFLFSEGLINGKEDINGLIIDQHEGVAKVKTEQGKNKGEAQTVRRLIISGGGKSCFTEPYYNQSRQGSNSQIKISITEIFALMDEFIQLSKIFQDTGGVHSAALCDKNGILLFSEDIGRHNAIDKIFGECILKGIKTNERVILTSGRVSSEIVHKVLKGNVPLLISKSAPTDMGIQLAEEFGITLIGFARGRRMNIYSQGWRVVNAA